MGDLHYFVMALALTVGVICSPSIIRFTVENVGLAWNFAHRRQSHAHKLRYVVGQPAECEPEALDGTEVHLRNLLGLGSA
jgi:hypothetical protein